MLARYRRSRYLLPDEKISYLQEGSNESKSESERNRRSRFLHKEINNMPPAEVIKTQFPGPGFRTVESTLETSKELDMTEIIVLGYDQDGDFVLKTSSMERKDILWLLHIAILNIMRDQ